MMPIIAFFDLIGLLIVLAVVIFPISKILSRIGWNPWFSLLWLIPVVNIAMLWVLAFAQWPIEQVRRP